MHATASHYTPGEYAGGRVPGARIERYITHRQSRRLASISKSKVLIYIRARVARKEDRGGNRVECRILPSPKNGYGSRIYIYNMYTEENSSRVTKGRYGRAEKEKRHGKHGAMEKRRARPRQIKAMLAREIKKREKARRRNRDERAITEERWETAIRDMCVRGGEGEREIGETVKRSREIRGYSDENRVWEVGYIHIPDHGLV